MKVYLCSRGVYSDYSVSAIFSTREAAEAYCAGDPDANDINEYEVDSEVGAEYGPVYYCSIYKETGYIQGPYVTHNNRPSEKCRVETRDYWTTIRVDSPISAEHAAKVAVEARQGWLRTRDMVAAPPTT